MAALEPEIAEVATRCVNQAVKERKVDFMAAVANVVPITLVSSLIGFRGSDLDELLRNAFDGTSLVGGRLTLPELEGLMLRVAEIGTWIVAQLETARQEPSEDILGAIARAMEADVLDVGEACIILQTLLSAGGESTTSLLGNSVRLLAEHHDVQSTLRAQPDLIPVFVEEALRLESPFRFLFRSTAKDTQLGDVPIAAGSTVLLFWGAANRDPAAFPQSRCHRPASSAAPSPRRLRARHPPLCRCPLGPARRTGRTQVPVGAHEFDRTRPRSVAQVVRQPPGAPPRVSAYRDNPRMTKGAIVSDDPPRASALDDIATQPDRRAQRRAQRQAQSRQNRIDILDAAEKVFGARGIHNGSLREIADEAGFSAAAIYLFFENKQHLLSETLTRRGDELLPIIRAVAEADHTPLEKLHVLIDDTVTFFDERPYFRRLMRHVRGDATITGPVLATFADRVNHRFEEALSSHRNHRRRRTGEGPNPGRQWRLRWPISTRCWSMSSSSCTRTTTRPHRARSRRRSFMASSTGLFARPPYRRERQMAFTLDPQVAVAMEPLSALATGMTRPEVGDVASRRLTMEAGQVFMETRRVMPSDVIDD